MAEVRKKSETRMNKRVSDSMAFVRNRIVIGLLILSVIGVAMFFFLPPKKESVEYHERAISRKIVRHEGQDWRGRLRNWVAQKSGVWLKLLERSEEEKERLTNEVVAHWHAMVKLKEAERRASGK
jgi:hypothetical protein